MERSIIMADVSHALEAKSDQLNAVDIMGYEPVIKITAVDVKQGDQPISVRFEGDHGRPWKPSKGMARILAVGWGVESDQWIGKRVQLYFEPSVKYAGQEVGGIRIRAMSDIHKNGMATTIAINRGKREPYTVKFLEVKTEHYPQAKFDKGLPKMKEAMESGEMTLQQVIAQCQKTGQLTPEQVQALEAAAPVQIDDDNVEQEIY